MPLVLSPINSSNVTTLEQQPPNTKENAFNKLCIPYVSLIKWVFLFIFPYDFSRISIILDAKYRVFLFLSRKQLSSWNMAINKHKVSNI